MFWNGLTEMLCGGLEYSTWKPPAGLEESGPLGQGKSQAKEAEQRPPQCEEIFVLTVESVSGCGICSWFQWSCD